MKKGAYRESILFNWQHNRNRWPLMTAVGRCD